MAVSSLVCLLLVAVLSVKCQAVNSKAQKKFLEHGLRVEGFTCGSPQPRAIPVAEIFKQDFIKSHHQIMPSSTVLFRCENAGCCTRSKETCRMQEEQEVELVFSVKTIGQRGFSFQSITASNHTRCGCGPKTRRRK